MDNQKSIQFAACNQLETAQKILCGETCIRKAEQWALRPPSPILRNGIWAGISDMLSYTYELERITKLSNCNITTYSTNYGSLE